MPKDSARIVSEDNLSFLPSIFLQKGKAKDKLSEFNIKIVE